ncbi:DNA helicase RecQ [Limibacter armeniacum]|uniref:DNA helicase RecQ n=1 Tax=Limibacter armeniacum TaxID=466084 RepID=UPI002FE50D45
MEMKQAQAALKKFFGYDSFRPMQADIIQSVLYGKDTVVLMPTGGGKSICYQIPAIVMPGLAIVVSPLIALMKDQVEGLNANGIPAAYLNSTQSLQEQMRVEQMARNGTLKLLYVSPEKLLSSQFMGFVRMLQVNLFAVDEAHCISAWGHDFRPEYTQLATLKDNFPQTPIIALTATADKITRRDIVHQLSLREPAQFVSSFDRPNLSLTVAPGQKKFQQILRFIGQRPRQSGIIYCLSRKNTENLAKKLQEAGYRAAYYHAGMSPDEREIVQENFIKDTAPIICATIAFGMGIDKSNVRWVIHYNLPKNIESYYQEIGRGGRDGLPSDTLLFYSYADVMTLRDIVDESAQKDLQLAKLNRMQQYAEAKTCRRKILLSYFGESLGKNCGNCDVCHNPPEYFDGTQIAQMALSAVARLANPQHSGLSKPVQIATGMLIDILRGSSRVDLIQKGYNNIRTYGAGRDISYLDWQLYLQQMLNLGLIEIAYDQGNIVRLTDESMRVLFEGQPVEFTKLTDLKEQFQKKTEKPKSSEEVLREELFEQLRQVRKEVAEKEGVPPYVVFNDATLVEMAKNRPVSVKDMVNISGVGEKKLRSYGNTFIGTIVKFIIQKTKEGHRIKGSTQLVTYALYKSGLSIDEIAKERKLQERSVYTHLAMLYEMGYNIDIFKYINTEDLDKVKLAIRATRETELLKPLYDYLGGEIAYHKIGFALAYHNRHA